ncbi:MAG TPA: DUF1614 domain-containing protein [Thermoplasmatales archaeon]|nr:DUF1614 domain-containing protein [Thermoplasmatales archaeon]
MMSIGFAIYLLRLIIPIVFLASIIYVALLIYTRAFKEMGFSAFDALTILVISFIFGHPIYVNGVDISNLYLFTYNNWIICINIGGGVIPIIISLYLAIKKKISPLKILSSLIVVSIFAYYVTYPDPNEGILSPFPQWLVPAMMASALSAILYIDDHRKAAPTAYISGTIGVLIGADILHLPELLSYSSKKPIIASIGGANVFDMIYITGILAAFLDAILFIKRRRET